MHCALFCDIADDDVRQFGQKVASIADLIKSTIVEPFKLRVTFSFLDCNEFSSDVYQSLKSSFKEAYPGLDIESGEMKGSMRKFVESAGQNYAIILLGGDADYYDTLSYLKKLHNVSIHLVRLDDSFSSELDEISDYIFMLNDGVLKPIKQTGSPMYFVSIQNYPLSVKISQVVNELNAKAIGSIGNSAILYGNSICIGFPSLGLAEKAIEKLNGSQYHGHFLKVELINDSPLTKILKHLKLNVTYCKSNDEVKTSTFIKMSQSDVSDHNVIKSFIDVDKPSGSQCILSSKPFLWVVFSFKSDAEKCLPNLRVICRDAAISEPEIDLKLTLDENTYCVESFEPLVSRNVHDDIDCIFFRYNGDVSPMKNFKPTKWSLLYNLFEKLYDLGAKKVISDGTHYCAHFGSASAYQHAVNRIQSEMNGLKGLELYHKVNNKQTATEIMNQYPGIPWCLTQELDLSCLVIKIESQFHDYFIEISKSILGNRECIFIKSTSDEIWIGFSDELICKNSEKTVNGFLSILKQASNVSIAKPSNDLLRSINFQDLAGDAHDLAFLSSQLKELSKRLLIIKRISLQRLQRMQKQECNEVVFHFTIKGCFTSNWYPSFPEPLLLQDSLEDINEKLAFDTIVKIFVKFSKVIPLAATASDFYNEVNLIYDSEYEAHTAVYYINKLTIDEVPYFKRFDGASDVQQWPKYDDNYSGPPAWSRYSEYYIINDKRKVLDKIAQKLSSNSSTNQCTTDIDVLDDEWAKKLQNLFVITTDRDFKLTSEMITIIKMNLVQMECPVCIEFEDKVWVGVDDLEKANKAKAQIEKIKFQLLHEYEADFEVRVVMESIQESPPKVTKMLVNKMIKPKKCVIEKYLKFDPVPLGHYNHSYREACNMSTVRYCDYCRMIENYRAWCAQCDLN